MLRLINNIKTKKALKTELNQLLCSQSFYNMRVRLDRGDITLADFKHWAKQYVEIKCSGTLFEMYQTSQITTLEFLGWFNQIRHSTENKDYLRRFCELYTNKYVLANT